MTPIISNTENTTFKIIVTNKGNVDLGNVTVKESEYDGLKYLNYENITGLWSYENGEFKLIGNLSVNSSASFNVIFKAVKSGNLTNIVIAKSNETEETTANNTTLVKPVIDLEIQKLVSNKTSRLGDIITWTIVVRNNGLDTAYNVSVRDELPQSLVLIDGETTSWIIDSIAANSSANITIKTKVNTTNTNITNVAILNGNISVNNTTQVGPLCDVEIAKLVDSYIHLKDDNIIWTVIVKNNGPDDALDVNVTDIIPDYISLIEANPSKGSYSNGTWIIGKLTAKETQKLTLTTTVKLSNITVVNTATVKTATPESDLTNNNASNKTLIQPECNLTVTKEVSDINPNFNDIITWTIKVTNNGPDAALNVKISDSLPDGLVKISESGDNFKESLASGETMTLTIQTKVTKTGNITNIATVTTTTKNNGNTTANKTIIVDPAADLEVRKIPNVEKIIVGGELTWTITVKNNGPDTADDVKVFENLPKELQYLSYTATKGSYENGLWSVGSLSNGESAILHLTTKVLEIGNITNPINVTSNCYDYNETNNYANATVESVNETPITPKNKTSTEDIIQIDEKATGNSISIILLALISLMGIRFRRKNE